MSDKELLEQIADTLGEWAEESVVNGYQTHQACRQHQLESEIREHLKTDELAID